MMLCNADQEPVVQGRAQTLRRRNLAGAVSFVAWKIGDDALKKTRNADYGVAVVLNILPFSMSF